MPIQKLGTGGQKKLKNMNPFLIALSDRVIALIRQAVSDRVSLKGWSR